MLGRCRAASGHPRYCRYVAALDHFQRLFHVPLVPLAPVGQGGLQDYWFQDLSGQVLDVLVRYCGQILGGLGVYAREGWRCLFFNSWTVPLGCVWFHSLQPHVGQATGLYVRRFQTRPQWLHRSRSSGLMPFFLGIRKALLRSEPRRPRWAHPRCRRQRYAIPHGRLAGRTPGRRRESDTERSIGLGP